MAIPVTAEGARFPRPRTIALLVLAILAVYAFEAHHRRQEKSTPAVLGDQSAYLGYARHLYESNYTVTEDRNRMPVYPFLLSLIYRPGMTEDEFLGRAQSFTVNLSILLLLGLYFVFRKFFPALPSIALLAATAFGVFIYRAGKAQVELVFYFVSFCAFVLLLQMLVKPRWWLALFAGVTTGLAHLTKASIVPALAIWAVLFAAQILWSFRANPWRRLGMLVLVLAGFFAVVFPYIRTSKRIYDSYFYNVNSTFVMWCDSSTEAYEFLSAHGDKDQWREVPADERPSFRKYWREHSLRQMVVRVLGGCRELAKKNIRAIGYYKFVIALAAAGIILSARRLRQVREAVAENPFAAVFSLLFLAGYFLLYAWYDTVSNDTRFVLSIFLPFLFAASIFVLRVGRDRVISFAGRQISFERFFSALILGMAGIDLLYNAAA
jgi:4-amino-4-deoxy-L-arabinose transferase-like glycosyltransferase